MAEIGGVDWALVMVTWLWVYPFFSLSLPRQQTTLFLVIYLPWFGVDVDMSW